MQKRYTSREMMWVIHNTATDMLCAIEGNGDKENAVMQMEHELIGYLMREEEGYELSTMDAVLADDPVDDPVDEELLHEIELDMEALRMAKRALEKGMKA